MPTHTLPALAAILDPISQEQRAAAEVAAPLRVIAESLGHQQAELRSVEECGDLAHSEMHGKGRVAAFR